MHHNKLGGSQGKCLELSKGQETIVLVCARRGDSEHHLNEFQRWARAAAISVDTRDGHETLTLLLRPQRTLCASTGHYPPSPPRNLCSPPLPGSRDPRITSLGEHRARLRLLQYHTELCCRWLISHSVPLPPPQPE